MTISPIVHPSVVITMFLTAICTTIVPIAILAVLLVKRKITILPVAVGAVAFFVSQIILRIPLLNILTSYPTFRTFSISILGAFLVGGLSAGIFEESARLFSAKFALINRRSFNDAVAFGLGHAFCEVVILVGFSSISNLIAAATLNNGMFDSIFSGSMPPETIEVVKNTIQNISIMDCVFSIVERVSSTIFHIFASVLVFRAVTKKKITYFFIAIAAHMLFNGIGTTIAQHSGILLAEISLFIMALAAGYYVIKTNPNTFGNADNYIRDEYTD